MEKFNEIVEAYSTSKNLLGEDEDELQSYVIIIPHFNEYDCNVCADVVTTIKKSKKNEQGYDFCAEKGDLKCNEELKVIQENFQEVL